MNLYIIILIIITSSISLLCSVGGLTQILRSHFPLDQPHKRFIAYMMMTNIGSMCFMLMNTIDCQINGNQYLQIISAYFYRALNQSTLGWVSMLSFVQFFILTTTTKTFLSILNQATSFLTFITFLFPLFVHIGPLISDLNSLKESYSKSQFCIIELERSTVTTLTNILLTMMLLLVNTLYQGFCFKWVSHFRLTILYNIIIYSNLYSPRIVQSLLREFFITPIILWIIFGIGMTLELVYQISQLSWVLILYQSSLIQLNFFGIYCFYVYIINPTIYNIVSWKTSILQEISSNKFETRTNTKNVTTERGSSYKQVSLRFTSLSLKHNFSRKSQTIDFYQSFSTNRQ